MSWNPKVIVIGAGIAGLSTAHYLQKYGYQVTVIETLNVPGGMARSERNQADFNTPSEYSWRGFGPWYHNAFSVMKEIRSPIDMQKSIYESELSHPIQFNLTPDQENPLLSQTDKGPSFDIGWNLSYFDMMKAQYLLLKQWLASYERDRDTYMSQNTEKELHKYLSYQGASTLSSIFGPFVGVDAGRASVHHIGDFFKKNVYPGSPGPYYHPETRQDGVKRKAWIQGSNSGWLILNRPSNEAWFNPWVQQLKAQGVKFLFNTSLDRLNWSGLNASQKLITSVNVTIRNGSNQSKLNRLLVADYYVLACNPFMTRDILYRTPELLGYDPELQKFEKLVAGGPHVQIAFQLVFSEEIKLPGDREVAVILTDSEFDITLYSQDQLFNSNVDLGNYSKGVRVASLWSGTATIDSVPGRVYGKTMLNLTKPQFIQELYAQIYRCETLNGMVKMANNGRSLKDFKVPRIQVWHGWKFPPEVPIVTGDLPKWVNTTENKLFEPNQKTRVANLFLAGAHTHTSADLWSMEAAVESGKRVSDLIANHPPTAINQSNPFCVFKAIDHFLYQFYLPHILDLILLFTIVIFVIILWYIKPLLFNFAKKINAVAKGYAILN
jgi:hypothetical protein